MRLYDETCVMLCEGQYIDIATSASDEPMTVELYFDMIGRKTAALISASIEAGALLATDDEAVITGYRRFGWALGIAFQLNDDLLGIWGQEQTTGKVPTDVARHKKTLPVMYAFEHARVRMIVTVSQRCTRSPSPATSRSPRSWRSWSGPAPRTSPAPKRSATATSASRSSTRSPSWSPKPARSSRASSSVSSAPRIRRGAASGAARSLPAALATRPRRPPTRR